MTTFSDRCYHWKLNPKPLYFHHPAGDGGGSRRQGGLSEREFKTERHSSSVSRLQGASCKGEGSKDAPIYIRPTPPTSRDTKQILPLTGDAAAAAHYLSIPDGGGGGGGP